MELNTAQLQTLKAYVIANFDSTFNQTTADALNVVASPDYWAWRSNVEKKEIISQPSQDATTFTWAGNGFITRSQGELECWNQLFNSTLTCNPSLPNVRQAFADMFSGAGNAAANRTHLLSVSRRKATIAEMLFSVAGTGVGNNGANARGDTTNPDVFGVGAEGELTEQDLVDAANS